MSYSHSASSVATRSGSSARRAVVVLVVMLTIAGIVAGVLIWGGKRQSRGVANRRSELVPMQTPQGTVLASLYYVDHGNGYRFRRGLDLMLHRASAASLINRIVLSVRAHAGRIGENTRSIGFDGKQLRLSTDGLHWLAQATPT